MHLIPVLTTVSSFRAFRYDLTRHQGLKKGLTGGRGGTRLRHAIAPSLALDPIVRCEDSPNNRNVRKIVIFLLYLPHLSYLPYIYTYSILIFASLRLCTFDLYIQ